MKSKARKRVYLVMHNDRVERMTGTLAQACNVARTDSTMPDAKTGERGGWILEAASRMRSRRLYWAGIMPDNAETFHEESPRGVAYSEIVGGFDDWAEDYHGRQRRRSGNPYKESRDWIDNGGMDDPAQDWD